MNKNVKKFLSFVTSGLVIILFIVPVLVGAQQGSGGNSDIEGSGPPSTSQSPIITIGNPFKCSGTDCTLSGLIRAIVNKILLPIGGLVAAVMIIYAGFLYVTAGGNETQIKKAHDALLYSVIGAAILLGAWVISEAIRATINQLGGSV